MNEREKWLIDKSNERVVENHADLFVSFVYFVVNLLFASDKSARFPMIGKFSPCFSRHWKNLRRVFQPLEEMGGKAVSPLTTALSRGERVAGARSVIPSACICVLKTVSLNHWNPFSSLPFMTEKKNSVVREEKSAWRAAAEYGVDMSLLESNLRKTPQERIRAHNRALAVAQKLRKAAESSHA